VKAQWTASDAGNTAEYMKSVADEYTEFNGAYATRLDGKALSTKVSEANDQASVKTVVSEMANAKVQVYGDVAILSYNFIGVTKDKDGKTQPTRAKSTRVYAKQGGKWMLVHANFGGLHPAWVVPVMLLMAMSVSGILGMALERFAYRPLYTRGATRLGPLISAVGASIFLQNAVMLTQGARMKVYMTGLLFPRSWYINIAGVRITALVMVMVKLKLMHQAEFHLIPICGSEAQPMIILKLWNKFMVVEIPDLHIPWLSEINIG
jgi:ketosteroid isomerase-like protein